MHPDDAQFLPRLRMARNRSCCLFGASWSHHASFLYRLTHFYLGFWVLTVRTGGSLTSPRFSAKTKTEES